MTRYNTVRFNKHIKTAGIPYIYLFLCAQALYVDEIKDRDDFDHEANITEDPDVKRIYAEMKEIATDAVNIFQDALENNRDPTA